MGSSGGLLIKDELHALSAVDGYLGTYIQEHASQFVLIIEGYNIRYFFEGYNIRYFFSTPRCYYETRALSFAPQWGVVQRRQLA